MKRTVPTLLVLLAATLQLSACSGNGESKAPPTKPVVVLKSYSITLHDQLEVPGTATASESVEITSRVAGRLRAIHFTDGQQVRKGDLIIALEQKEEQAQLAAATAQLAEHSREIKRLERLLANKAAAARDLDARKTLATITASEIKQIEARIDDLTLRAPFDGTLGIRRISPGALIQPGQVIATLTATNPIKLDFSIPATALAGIAAGTAVQARADTLPDRIFRGEIAALDSKIDPLTRAILARAVIDNSDGALIPGMLMHVTVLQHERQALVVPEECITQKQRGHFLTLVNNDNEVELRPVSIGARQNGLVEIRDGLAAGERVIVRGMGFVKPGQRVAIAETWERIRPSQFPQPGESGPSNP